MDFVFLLSDSPSGYGQQLLQDITNRSCPVVVFVKDHESVSTLCGEFPSVIWIVVDVNRNADTVAEFLRVLPVPNYVVNFSGPNFSTRVHEVWKCGNTWKDRERARTEMTLDDIVDDDDGEECKILINVVDKTSGLKRKSKTISKTVGKLVKGAKKKLASRLQDDDSQADENEPLIRRNDFEDEPVEQGFIMSLLTACCPCLLVTPEPEYCFQSPQELRNFIRIEQLKEIRKVLRKMNESCLSKWRSTLEDLRRTESQKIEELVSKINDFREREEHDLSAVKEKQNRNTKENLSSVLSAEILKKIEDSRSRQTKGKVEYDADRAFREGQMLISKQVAIEKAQLQESHYCKIIESQLQKLTEINTKYQKKQQTLHSRHFRHFS